MLYRLMGCLMMMSLSACVSAPGSRPGVCSGTEASRAALADALVRDGGPQSRRAGLLVIEQLDAGCHP